MPSASVLEKEKVVPMVFRRHGNTDPKNRGHALGNAKPASFYMHELERQGDKGGSLLLDASVLTATRPFNPQFIANDKKVLRFGAYFLEAVHESNLENYRVRCCDVLYYLEDDTMQITENKIENSGMMQGNFVKRHRIPMPESDDRGNLQFFTMHDFNVGRELTFYGRTFHLISADPFTRDYLTSRGVHIPMDEEVPRDPYTVLRQAHMARETGQDQDANYGKKKYPMKDFMEASLGKFARPNDHLRRFLAHDRDVLRFFAIWDDTEKLYGIRHRYTLHFFLADNTIEILESYERNSGCDPFPKLLNRTKLSKDPARQACAAVCDEGADGEDVTPVAQQNYYSWEDLAIGKYLQVYSRRILLLDADQHTRDWYNGHAMSLASAIPVKDEIIPRPVSLPPQHDGLGSEEDSLQSCYHLLPKAPLKSIESLDTTEVLRFRARFETTLPEDIGRRFVVSIIVSDQSVSIAEFVQRNSGIVGGKFLERTRVKRTRPDGSVVFAADGRPSWLGLDDFYVGARVRIAGRTFILFEMDEYSAKYMEARPAKFARSDKLEVLRKVRAELDKSALLDRMDGIQQKQQRQIDVEELTSLLDGLVTDFTQHEATTVIRNYGDKMSMKIDTETLPQLLT
ncbi:EF-hand domain-containing member C2 [Phytophthora boehmeriae]|uniref:EF-hand domain-containing member C2 n=1 Tax=Phytophthora boehmeriae TaxID=109152 RepID=A0A8T1WZ92_9STRA|nr:EF-hand domain-containing member C2 [Phytophthora boehmeriae]